MTHWNIKPKTFSYKEYSDKEAIRKCIELRDAGYPGQAAKHAMEHGIEYPDDKSHDLEPSWE